MKILVIQQKMIGDVLTSSILFEALREKYPDAQLHYVVNHNTTAVVENNPHIDKLIIVTKEALESKAKFFSFLKEIKKYKYDIVLDAYGKTSSNLITFFSGAKTKIGKHKGYTSFLYSHTLKDRITTKNESAFAIKDRLQLLEPLDIFKSIIKPKIYLTNDELEASKNFLTKSNLDLKKPLLMISVLGSSNIKTYPFAFMAQVLDNIHASINDAQILFNYIPNQKEDAKAIFDLCKPETQKQIFFNVFGKSLREFLAITKHCTALIGNEGGAVNMAKALHVPTFTIFSPWINKETWNLFEDGKQNVSVHLKDFKPELYKDVSHPKELKSQSEKLYQEFSPNLFEKQLQEFIKQF